LLVGRDFAVGTSVDTGEVLVVAETAQEHTVLIGSWGIVLAADAIVDMFTVVCGVRARGVASLQAESTSTHEVVPFNGLDNVAVERVGEDETTQGVTALIGTMGVHLTSRVIRGDVDKGLLNETNNLDVIRGLHKLNTSQGTLGDDTGAMRVLGAPGNCLALDDTNLLVGLLRTPEAEVIDTVDEGGLAERIWASSGRVADVVTLLCATFTGARVGLVGKRGVLEFFGGERGEVWVRCALGESSRGKCGGECESRDEGGHH